MTFGWTLEATKSEMGSATRKETHQAHDERNRSGRLLDVRVPSQLFTPPILHSNVAWVHHCLVRVTLTTWRRRVLRVTCSEPQAKLPVSRRRARYLTLPPRVRTEWTRFDESSLVMAGWRPSSNLRALRLEFCQHHSSLAGYSRQWGQETTAETQDFGMDQWGYSARAVEVCPHTTTTAWPSCANLQILPSVRLLALSAALHPPVFDERNALVSPAGTRSGTLVARVTLDGHSARSALCLCWEEFRHIAGPAETSARNNADDWALWGACRAPVDSTGVDGRVRAVAVVVAVQEV